MQAQVKALTADRDGQIERVKRRDYAVSTLKSNLEQAEAEVVELGQAVGKHTKTRRQR